MRKIAIFASGNGSNAENIVRFFDNQDDVTVNLIVSDNPQAFVLERSKSLCVESVYMSRSDMASSDKMIKLLLTYSIDLIVLAGYLGKIPSNMIKAFPNRIMNIHPALLPKYGGKGMFGHHVHEAALAHGETVSGITIHLVDEIYDNGKIICQASCDVLPNDTPDSLAERIHRLEYLYFPVAIADYLERLDCHV